MHVPVEVFVKVVMKSLLPCSVVVLLSAGGAVFAAEPPPPPFPMGEGASPQNIALVFSKPYLENCAVCHGENLTGEAQGAPLVGVDLKYGDTLEQLEETIARGFPEKGMPAWSATLSEQTIKNLALYVSEMRSGFSYADFNYSTPMVLPADDIQSEKHTFHIEQITADLDPLPFSIAPLPDGRILVTEKKKGLRIVTPDGYMSPLIEGTPKAYDDTYVLTLEQEWGHGWMMEVAIHPDYEENGWVYLLYGDRCEDCNELSLKLKQPVSMNKVVRGRIKDDKWVDEQVIWQADKAHYGVVPDIAAGGRMSFDNKGHVFFSVGVKGYDNHTGIQNLNLPWGKIHRVFDDGRIPDDNPYTGVEGALKSIWTYGHRSPQGLEYNVSTGLLWGTEMGPRGGDEVNLLIAGRNYGWPLYSLGTDYDGSPVEYGKDLGIEFELRDIEQPVVDLTPSPAVSSLIFYDGADFPEWRGDILVGALKGRSLTRMEVKDNQVVHRETLFEGLARVRDVEAGPHGEVYVLLEHTSGGQIVRLVPRDPQQIR